MPKPAEASSELFQSLDVLLELFRDPTGLGAVGAMRTKDRWSSYIRYEPLVSGAEPWYGMIHFTFGNHSLYNNLNSSIAGHGIE